MQVTGSYHRKKQSFRSEVRETERTGKKHTSTANQFHSQVDYFAVRQTCNQVH